MVLSTTVELIKKFIEYLEKDNAQFPPYGGNEKPKILETNNIGSDVSRYIKQEHYIDNL